MGWETHVLPLCTCACVKHHCLQSCLFISVQSIWINSYIEQLVEKNGTEWWASHQKTFHKPQQEEDTCAETPKQWHSSSSHYNGHKNIHTVLSPTFNTSKSHNLKWQLIHNASCQKARPTTVSSAKEWQHSYLFMEWVLHPEVVDQMIKSMNYITTFSHHELKASSKYIYIYRYRHWTRLHLVQHFKLSLIYDLYFHETVTLPGEKCSKYQCKVTVQLSLLRLKSCKTVTVSCVYMRA